MKKYFYVLHPILVMKSIEEERGIVPTAFKIALEKLVLPAELKQAVAKLLESKRAGSELDRGKREPAISDFIGSELARWEAAEIPKSVVVSQGNRRDKFLRERIEEVW